jgi:hypothetical protein
MEPAVVKPVKVKKEKKEKKEKKRKGGDEMEVDVKEEEEVPKKEKKTKKKRGADDEGAAEGDEKAAAPSKVSRLGRPLNGWSPGAVSPTMSVEGAWVGGRLLESHPLSFFVFV